MKKVLASLCLLLGASMAFAQTRHLTNRSDACGSGYLCSDATTEDLNLVPTQFVAVLWDGNSSRLNAEIETDNKMTPL